MISPTDKQLKAIAFIEITLPYLKFVGSTKGEAAEFISIYLERAKNSGNCQKKTNSNDAKITFKNGSYIRIAASQGNARSKRATITTEKTDMERYEEYIDSVSANYLDDTSDGYGWSTEHKEIARRIHPFEDWKKNGG